MKNHPNRPVRLVRPLYVVADDLTGAAEIAGIASSFGLDVCLFLDLPDGEYVAGEVDVVVVATDSRSVDEREAMELTRRVARALPHEVILFKKTDSALRGHIMAELRTMMETTGRERVLFIPANPSKGRIIRDGIYSIDGVELTKTAFSYDPEFPAMTADVKERFPEMEDMGMMPDVSSVEDIRYWIELADDRTLLAGAADLFTVLLQHIGCERQPDALIPHFPVKEVLVVCGSTQSRPEKLPVPVAAMPLDIYNGVAGTDGWVKEAAAMYATHQALALAIPHRHLTGKTVALRLRDTMAEVVKALVDVHQPKELMIEGGATAFACCPALGLTHFIEICQLAPGVVRMRADNGMHVTLKPGSYPWR